MCTLTHAFVVTCVESAKRLYRPYELFKVQAAITVSIKQLEDAHDEGISS